MGREEENWYENEREKNIFKDYLSHSSKQLTLHKKNTGDRTKIAQSNRYESIIMYYDF